MSFFVISFYKILYSKIPEKYSKRLIDLKKEESLLLEDFYNIKIKLLI